MTIALMLLTAALVFCGATLMTTNNINIMLSDDGRVINAKIDEMGKLVDANFYEETDQKAILDGIAKGYITALGDRYSTYLTDSEHAADDINKAGKREGIGITVVIDQDTHYMYVTEVVPNGPAHRAGILAGDQISAVGDLAVTAENYTEAFSAIAGEQGTTVVLTLARPDAPVQRTVVRGQYEAQAVTYKMLGDIAYIKINTFNRLTYTQFTDALDNILPTAKAILFDLRNNSGGFMDEAFKILDEICPAGTLASAQYKTGEPKVMSTSDANEIKLPMAVLANGETASAAELFVAAIRDFEKGPVIGEKTYGKGVMQTTYTLKDKSAIRITVAHFLPPGGETFHNIGIEPQQIVTPTDEQRKYFYKLNETNDPFIMAGMAYLQGVK